MNTKTTSTDPYSKRPGHTSSCIGITWNNAVSLRQPWTADSQQCVVSIVSRTSTDESRRTRPSTFDDHKFILHKDVGLIEQNSASSCSPPNVSARNAPRLLFSSASTVYVSAKRTAQNEEWWHRRFAERDLDVLAARI